MTYNLGAVVSHDFSLNDAKFTYNIEGTPDPVNDVMKAVGLSTTAASTVHLAAAGDKVFGRLEVVEQRVVYGVQTAQISRQFKSTLPVAAGLAGLDVPAIGDTVVGAGNGFVKSLNANNAKVQAPWDNVVVELTTDSNGNPLVVVEKL